MTAESNGPLVPSPRTLPADARDHEGYARRGLGHEFARVSVQSAETLPADVETPVAGHHPVPIPSIDASRRGSPLPSALQARFEHSLGESLTDVRVHTDVESAHATERLDAQAFAVGRDIHFGSGEYQPGSDRGLNLLAHELIHVAQQKAAGRRAEANGPLPTSGPLEIEARALTLPLLRGMPVRPSTARETAPAAKKRGEKLDPGWGLEVSAPGRKGDYNLGSELAQQAAATEQLDQEMGMGVSAAAEQEVLTATNVADVQAAEREIAKIKAATPKLEEAIGTSWTKGMGEVSKSTLSDNVMAQAELGEYLAYAGIQSTSMGNFQQQYAKLSQDGDRLLAMLAMMDVSGSTGTELGEAVVKSQQLSKKDRAKMAGDVEAPHRHSTLATKKGELRDWQEKMGAASKSLAVDEGEETRHAYLVQSKVSDIAAGLKPRDAPDAVKNLNELKDRLDRIKGSVKMISGFATKAIGGYLGTAAGAMVEAGVSGIEAYADKAEEAGAKAKEKVSEASADLAGDLVGFLATIPWHGELALAESRAQAALEKQTFDATQAELKDLKSRMIGYETAVKKYLNTASSLQQAKVHVRRMMAEVGAVADKSGGGKGHKWEVLGVFMGEAETYLAQCNATIGVGQNEMAQAVETSGRRRNIMGADGRRFWWSARTEKRVASDSYKWVLEKNYIYLPYGRDSAEGEGGSNRDTGANRIIADEIKVLEKNRKDIEQMRNVLAKEFTAGL